MPDRVFSGLVFCFVILSSCCEMSGYYWGKLWDEEVYCTAHILKHIWEGNIVLISI